MPSKVVPWIPTPPIAVKLALEWSWVTNCDIVYDLGCGDGRVPVIAARDYGVRRAVCIEIDPVLAEVARIRAREEGVADRVEVREEDFHESSLRGATLVYAYLYPSVLDALKPKMEEELAPGARVVTLDMYVPGWTPVLVRRFEDTEGRTRTIRVYVIGASDGKWSRLGEEIRDWTAIRAWAANCNLGVQEGRRHREEAALPSRGARTPNGPHSLRSNR